MADRYFDDEDDLDDEFDEDDYYRAGGRSAEDAIQAVETLHKFFAAAEVERVASAKHRYRCVERHLTEYLNSAELSAHLGTYPAERINEERRSGTPNPFFRVCTFDDLVCALGGFVADEWLLPKRSDARTQVALAGRLLAWLRHQNLLEMWRVACALHESEDAVRQARDRIASPDRAIRARIRRGADVLPFVVPDSTARNIASTQVCK